MSKLVITKTIKQRKSEKPDSTKLATVALPPPSEQFEVDINDEGKIVDFLGDGLLEPKPEEFVRQKYLRVLHFEYHYPKEVLAREIPIYYGSKEAKDSYGHPARADIVIYADAKAKKKKDQGKIEIIIECKAPTIQDGFNQLASYIFNTSANGAVWYNDTDEIKYYRRVNTPQNSLIDWLGIPRPGETWDALGVVNKNDLNRPKDIKGLLRRCHNRIHGRGNDGDETDLTMDMVRIILAKAKDEELPSERPEFYCTPTEYSTTPGQQAVADRIQRLFELVVQANPTVFRVGERITIGPRSICDVVSELQSYRLLSDLYRSGDWDLMGNAYEQYTATYLKRQKGQFFTNRLITDFMVKVLDPDYTDIVLDPAGGSGGFLTSTMRYVRKKILDRQANNSGQHGKIASQRQLDLHRTQLFMVETSKRLVKIAKTAMILNGDGHAGMTHGDSLGPYDKLDKTLQGKAGKGKPTVILTNPPFAGVGEGRIKDEKILNHFVCGMKWTERGGKLELGKEINDDGAPPEMLFFERCLDWVAPGGRIGIVMPKGFLDSKTYWAARNLLLTKYKLLAVVNCDKNTFQPHTGVRTCIVFVERPDKAVPKDYSIFMAISRRVGQDSEGVPVFKLDANNNPTDVLDEDLSVILNDWKAHVQGTLKPSEYRYSITRSMIKEGLSINPQFYLPSFNQTIKDIESIDDTNGWKVVSLDQVEKGVQIFKAPRMKTENLIVDRLGQGCEVYHTPSSVLQEKGDAAKIFDLSRAQPKQIKAIKGLRVQEGDILITRSGTIGRVAYATSRLKNVILSDDMIRVRIADETIRFYVYAFLQSKAAHDQMLKNEYGTIQQHLEARHIQSILIPLPPDWKLVKPMIDVVEQAVVAREALEKANGTTNSATQSLIQLLVKQAQTSNSGATDKEDEADNSEVQKLMKTVQV